MHDARFAVRDGLRQLLEADPAAWPGPTPLVFRGRLLDLVGSDARPLVQLLVRVGESGVVERLRAAEATGTPWTAARGPLVVALTDETFLRRDMAQWGVECWAHALGLARVEELTPGIARAMPAPAALTASSVLRPGGVPAPGGVAAGPARAGAAAQRAATARPYVPPNAPPGYRPPRPSIGPLGTRSSPGGLSATTVRRSVIAVGVASAMAVAIFVALGPRRANSSARGVAPMAAAAPSVASAPLVASAPGAVGSTSPQRAVRPPDAAAMGVPVMPQALPGVTSGALPSSRADSSRLLFVRPALRAPVAPLAPPVGPSVDERPGFGLRNVGTGALDRVVKRNGEVIVGRVEVIRASEVQFLDAETRLRYAIPKREIREIITEFGNRVRFDGDRTDAPSAVAMGPLVRRGVGGTYDAAYRVQRVTGSPECRGLWQRPPADDRLIIVHTPGADTLSIRADNGGTFSAVLDPAANFATSLLPQTEASVGSSAITSRMNGRFTADGFTAEVTIIGYRRQPTGRDISCSSVLNAYGRRRAGF